MRARFLDDPFLNKNHLESVAPLARQVDAYVAPRLTPEGTEVPGEYALYAAFEPLPGVDPDEVKRFFQNGGFSIAFFGHGVGHGPRDTAALHVTVGVTPDVFGDGSDARQALSDLADALPETAVEVRSYHEHALVTAATLAVAIVWVKSKVADKLFDVVWNALAAPAVRTWRGAVNRVKLVFRTPNGVVHAQLPPHSPDGDRAVFERTVRQVVDEVEALERGTVRRRLSITVTERWTLETHAEDLPPGAPPFASDDLNP